MRMLDADVLVDIQRSHPPAVAWYQSLTEMPQALVVAAKVVGVWKVPLPLPRKIETLLV